MPTKQAGEGKGVRVALVASEYNYDVTMLMLERAKEEVAFLGASLGPVVKTPGVYDMPLAVKVLFGRADVDAVVALGAVIEGEELARLESPLVNDNFEGIATRPGPAGETLVYLISDDNFSSLQRTYLLQFALDGPSS